MKISKLCLICMCCFLTALAANGQSGSAQTRPDQTGPGILGYLDPHTRSFHPLRQAAGNAIEPPAVTTFTGTVKLTITITVKSAGITSINCAAFVSAEDNLLTGSPRSLSEIDFVAATGTGATRTCTLSVPYSWALATQSTDTMNTSYEVGNTLVLIPKPPTRISALVPVDSRKVPANGTITTLTASATI
jgi:hypothetical protein